LSINVLLCILPADQTSPWRFKVIFRQDAGSTLNVVKPALIGGRSILRKQIFEIRLREAAGEVRRAGRR